MRIGSRDLALLIDRFQILFGRPGARQRSSKNETARIT